MNVNINYAPQIDAAARAYNLDPRLLKAVAAQETGGPDCDSGRNVIGDGGHGRGLFQIDDRWHDFAKTPGAMDPAKNAMYAARMISDNLKRYGGNVRDALSAYNAGDPRASGTKTTWADGQTLGYADSVMRHYQRLAQDNAPETSESVNALQQLFNQSPQSPSAPSCPTGNVQSWLQARGLDSTGHSKNGNSLDNYITGDDSE
jgi:hypothetical protein